MGPVESHYFTGQPDGRSAPGTVRVRLPGTSFTLATDSGVFSRHQVDPGTRVLLSHMPLPDGAGEVLDLGCGYGPITFSVALQRPRLRVWAVDVNERALDLVRSNAAALGVNNVIACLPDEVPEHIRFRAVCSNPPIRVGKAALHDLLLRWLSRLDSGGVAHLVVQRNLGSDSLAKWLIEQGYSTTRAASQRGYRILVVRRS